MHNAFIARLLDWDNRTPRAGHRLVNGVLRRLRIPAMLVPPSFSWTMANVELRMNLFHLASQVAAFEVPGQFVELGCNAGESSIVIQSVLDEMAPDRELHVYDSFEGLPPLAGADDADGVYEAGAMRAQEAAFHANFARAGVRERAQLHRGYFEATIPSELPDEIAFAFIDCDLESSTAHVLPHVYERMSPGAICMFGVYCDESVLPQWHGRKSYKSPGVKRATDAFFANKPEKPSVLYANEYSNGYFRKLASPGLRVCAPATQRAA
jgi:O-methyltransferase